MTDVWDVLSMEVFVLIILFLRDTFTCFFYQSFRSMQTAFIRPCLGVHHRRQEIRAQHPMFAPIPQIPISHS
jgi:hypothetical protein